MARARNIKPGFFKNEELVELPFEDRLLFIGLWTLADCRGVLEHRPKRIKMELFPADDVDVPASLERLAERGLIRIYEHHGVRAISIPKFLQHQNPHNREKPLPLPDFNGDFPEAEPDPNADATGSTPVRDGCQPDAGTGPAPGQPDASPAESLLPITESGIPSGGQAVPVPLHCPHDEIVALYHEVLPELPRVKNWTEKRKGYLRSRWRSDPKRQNLTYWRKYFEHVRNSPFLMGEVDPMPGRSRFQADLEWLVCESNFTKVIERKYHEDSAA